MGQGPETDLLSLSFSSNDLVGHCSDEQRRRYRHLVPDPQQFELHPPALEVPVT